mgnify:CR=1 FL=1
MTEPRWSFFKEGDSSFGMFYPKHYTLAGFENEAAAERAATALRDGGFESDNVRVVNGRFLVEELESQPDDAGWLERMKATISEFIGTETYFIDQDIGLARRGGAFVFVYTPDEKQGELAETILRQSNPEYARRYLDLAIERIIEPQH